MLALVPKWKFPHTLPAFRDLESVTALEAIHVLYGVIAKLVEEHQIQDEEINEAIEYMKTHLAEHVGVIMDEALTNGIIHENLKVDYDASTEALTLALVVTGGE